MSSDSNTHGYVEEPKEIKMNNKLKKIKFGTVNGNFKLTDKGKYSISPPESADKISKIILQYVNKNAVITDGTCGLGGNSMSFSKHFKQVNSVEMDPVHYKFAKHNLEVAHAKNVSLVKGDYTKVYKNFKQDVIFIDAPWTGVDYYLKKNLQLYLGDESIATFCNKLIDYTDIVVLNLPTNFDFQDFMSKTVFTKLTIYVIKKNKVLLGVLTK